jgi:hypothetical protein
MAVMESLFPDWSGPTHHDVSPRWRVLWLEFAHKPKNEIISGAMLDLMENEVPGLRVPGPVPPHASPYFPASKSEGALNHVKNYSREQLEMLLPSHQVLQEGNMQRSFIECEGLTQESYTVFNENKDVEQEDSREAQNLFARSLVVDDLSAPPMPALARDNLKPHINEVLQCLDYLNSKESINKARKVLNDLANELRLELATSSRPGTKRNMENCQTVNINVEEDSGKKGRTYASRNC